MGEIKIPKNPKEITNHWLAEALRESGRLKDAKIVNHAVQTFEIGIGWANIVRISVEYDPPVEGAPSSMISNFVSVKKIPHAEKLMDFSDTEANFYTHLGSNSGISVTQCFYADIDMQTGDYLLLMEDMSKCRVGDLSGNLEDVETGIRLVARFHAKWWNCGN